MKTGTLYLTNGNTLGNRLIGYELYDSESKGFIGMSEKQIKDGIKKGMNIKGFIIDDNGKLVLDEKGMNYTNLQMKSGVNKLSWMNDNFTSEISKALIIVGKKNISGKVVYETVNAMHARVDYDKLKIQALMQVIDVYGARLENGKIILCGETDSIKNEVKIQSDKDNKAVKKTNTIKKNDNTGLIAEGTKENKK